MAKRKLNLSLDQDTIDRLKCYALEHHRTMSQCVTDLVWSCDIQWVKLNPLVQQTVTSVQKDKE